MRGSHPARLWSRSVLSLVLLVANVGAPFHMSDMGRLLLASLPQPAYAAPVVRVRAVTTAGVTHGFCAVIGLIKCGPGRAEPGASPNLSLALRTSPAHVLSGRHVDRPASRPHIPLRC